MQCTIKFSSIDEVKQVVDDLSDAQSEHLVSLRDVLTKELTNALIMEMRCVSLEKDVQERCMSPHVFNMKSDINYDPLKPCGCFP